LRLLVDSTIDEDPIAVGTDGVVHSG
jgi:hypothetical protein